MKGDFTKNNIFVMFFKIFFCVMFSCEISKLQTFYFFVFLRFAVGCGKFYLFGNSGGQSGWLEGWAARKAGLLSNSRSMRKIMGYGRKSTWNLKAN